MSLKRFILISILSVFAPAAIGAVSHYDAEYRAQIRPEAGVIAMELKLSGERLPRRIVLRIDPRRHRNFSSTDPLQIEGKSVTWQPRGKFSRLSYEFVVNHERAPQRYDSLMTKTWAVFRGDDLVPPANVTARRGLQSRASLTFTAPKGWSVITPYAPVAEHQYRFDAEHRRFDRPTGWMLAGSIGTRGETIGGVHAIVAAPEGDSARRQDTLAFLNWNLPLLLEVFPEFPRRLLIVSADDPMWRGGLSGPTSLFLHSDRPLISENRTSTLLHELVHVAMGIHADDQSDWIVEGLAEYYSIETLRRSGSISERRYEDAIERMEKWARRSSTLFDAQASGSTTAHAVLTMKAVDAEIRKLTNGKASLDDVARKLAAERGEVGLERFQKAAQQIAGQPLLTLEHSRLTKRTSAPAR